MTRTWMWLVVAVVPLSACSSAVRHRREELARARSDVATSSRAPVAAAQPRVVSRRVVSGPAPLASAQAPAGAPAPARRIVASSPVPMAPSTPVAAAPAAPPRAPATVAKGDEIPAYPARPLNATCPVMLGNPVDPACTSVWHGRVIAFCDVEAKTRWDANPEAYALNLPLRLVSGSAGDVRPWLVSAPSNAVPTPTPLASDPAPAPSARASQPEPAPAAAPPGEGGAGDEEGECADGKCRVPGR